LWFETTSWELVVTFLIAVGLVAVAIIYWSVHFKPDIVVEVALLSVIAEALGFTSLAVVETANHLREREEENERKPRLRVTSAATTRNVAGVMIENVGRSVAVHCQARFQIHSLSLASGEGKDVRISKAIATHLPLEWEKINGVDSLARDIPPGGEERLEIAGLASGDSGVFWTVGSSAQSGGAKLVTVAGSNASTSMPIVGFLTISANNVQATRRLVRLTYSLESKKGSYAVNCDAEATDPFGYDMIHHLEEILTGKAKLDSEVASKAWIAYAHDVEPQDVRLTVVFG
jgi:hypothetical protein